MKLNISFKSFKKNHKRKKNQILFISKKCNDYRKVENLFKFLLVEKNSFIFESQLKKEKYAEGIQLLVLILTKYGI